MSETTALGLPLLQPSQAQKHVIVNEALVRLDALAQITLQSRIVTTPPEDVSDGTCYALPENCTSAWAGQDGKLAIASNGGWVFVAPRDGWSAWIIDESVRATCLMGGWVSGVLAAAQHGAASRFAVLETDYVITAGGAQPVGLEIPKDTVLFACSARILTTITGSATSWTLALADGSITFGTGMGLLSGSYCTGILGQPAALYATKAVRVSPVGGTFAGGRLRLAAHFYHIDLPS